MALYKRNDWGKWSLWHQQSLMMWLQPKEVYTKG